MVSTTRVIVYGRTPSRCGGVVHYPGVAPLTAPIKRPRCARDRGSPRGLLAPLPLSDSASALNANNSPFLHKLPPEIRMRIYEYALGGSTIFFDHHYSSCTNKCHRNRYRCRAYMAREDTSEENRRTSGSEQVKESKHRPQGDWEPSGNVSLELLLTCRQVYNEAVLVPFSANEFGLSSNWFMSDGLVKILFLRDLVPDQSRAIHTLHIRGVLRHGFVPQHIKALSGLKRLKLGFEWDMMAIHNMPGLLMTALEDRFERSGVSVFAVAILHTVDFTIDLTVLFQEMQAVLAQEEELVDWVESKRAVLLTKQTPVARTRQTSAVASQPTRISERIRAQKGKVKVSAEE